MSERETCDYYETARHDEFCPHAPLTITRGAFVDAAEGGAKQAIEAYLFWLNDEKVGHEHAVEMALMDVNESASCFAGVGSCGRGWCKH